MKSDCSLRYLVRVEYYLVENQDGFSKHLFRTTNKRYGRAVKGPISDLNHLIRDCI